jgi:hypothetical protein
MLGRWWWRQWSCHADLSANYGSDAHLLALISLVILDHSLFFTCAQISIGLLRNGHEYILQSEGEVLSDDVRQCGTNTVLVPSVILHR